MNKMTHKKRQRNEQHHKDEAIVIAKAVGNPTGKQAGYNHAQGHKGCTDGIVGRF